MQHHAHLVKPKQYGGWALEESSKPKRRET